MAYSDFTLKELMHRFQLHTEEKPDVFSEVPEGEVSPLLHSLLQVYVPLALAIHTEKACDLQRRRYKMWHDWGGRSRIFQHACNTLTVPYKHGRCAPGEWGHILTCCKDMLSILAVL